MTTKPLSNDRKHFVLIYDVTNERLIDVLDFGDDSEAAMSKYVDLEREAREAQLTGREIVLVGSDSLETVKATHSHYFNGDAIDRIIAS
jgi:hypothetical protein